MHFMMTFINRKKMRQFIYLWISPYIQNYIHILTSLMELRNLAAQCRAQPCKWNQDLSKKSWEKVTYTLLIWHFHKAWLSPQQSLRNSTSQFCCLKLVEVWGCGLDWDFFRYWRSASSTSYQGLKIDKWKILITSFVCMNKIWTHYTFLVVEQLFKIRCLSVCVFFLGSHWSVQATYRHSQ